MQLLPGLISIFLVLELSLPSTNGCVQKVSNVIMKTTTTASPVLPSTAPPAMTESPAELDQEESFYAINSKLQAGGYFMEVEESIDKSVKVYRFKELPRIYSQIINNETHTPTEPPQTQDQNVTEIVEVDQIEPGPPPIQSLIDDQSDPSWSAGDEAVRKDWYGTCSSSNWNYCNKLKEITVMNVYTYIKDKDILTKDLELDCLLEPVVCLHNGWTANRCHILCMSKCNRAILQGWEKFVSYEGQCKYIRR